MMNRWNAGMFSSACRLSLVACCTAAAVLLIGCVEDSGTSTDNEKSLEGTTSANLALTMDILADTDVSGFKFKIEPVDCDTGLPNGEPAITTGFQELEDMLLREVAPGVAGFPDASKGHLFVDKFFNVPAGCYNVTAKPMDAPGTPSQDCAVAEAWNVEVVDQSTTEILVISQCVGEERGGLDVVAALNHPPVITDLRHKPSKFVYECEWTKICATASDPDGDPLEFMWGQNGGPALTDDPIVIKNETHADGSVTECIKVAGANLGEYELWVWVHDLMDDENGVQIPIAEYLQRTDPSATSEDHLEFPLHVRPDVDAFCYDEETGGFERLPDARVPDFTYDGCYPWGPEMFYCMPEHANTAVTCPNGVFDPSTVFDPCEPDPEPECVDYTKAQLRQLITCDVDGGTATFTMPADACPETLSFSSYKLKDNWGFIHPFDGQVLYDNVTDEYGPGPHTVYVDLPTYCGYQSDLYLGEALYDLDPNNGHGNRILCWDVKEKPWCGKFNSPL